MPEFPPPIRLFGEPPLPDEPYGEGASRGEMPLEDRDRFGAEAAADALAARLEAVQGAPARFGAGGAALLSPPFSPARDHVAGPIAAPTTLVFFGAFGTPATRPLGRLIDAVRQAHPATVRIVWRHHPDPSAHPHAVMLALASEAAAVHGHFWATAMELLRLRHSDPPDLHAALIRAGLDPDRTVAAMRTGTGADRIAADVASARSSGVAYSPALFVDGVRYGGEIARRPLLEFLAAADRSAIPAAPGRRTRHV